MRAIVGNRVIAESPRPKLVNGKWYFEQSDVALELLFLNGRTQWDHWKGESVLFDIIIENERVEDGAMCYQLPLPMGDIVKGKIAFSKDVLVIP